VLLLWVAIVGEQQFAELSLESARRVHSVLGELLDEAT